MKRAALYMRVSTKGHGQTTETQALALQEYAQRRGFEIAGEYRDEGISGSKDSRPSLDRLMKDARSRKFDVVIVARFGSVCPQCQQPVTRPGGIQSPRS